MADPSLQRVMLELDATRGQETAILECPPFQVLHDQEVDAILAADVEHWADMRMIQGGQGFCLQLESLFQLRI
jgi:hypothetical protein